MQTDAVSLDEDGFLVEVHHGLVLFHPVDSQEQALDRRGDGDVRSELERR